MATHRLERVTGRVDEEEAAVDAGIGDELLAHRRQLLAQVRRVLILDLRDQPAKRDRIMRTGAGDDIILAMVTQRLFDRR